jgi:hypothetical protein
LKQLVGARKLEENIQALALCLIVGGGFPPALVPELRPVPTPAQFARVYDGLKAMAVVNGVVMDQYFTINTVTTAMKKACSRGMLVH